MSIIMDTMRRLFFLSKVSCLMILMYACSTTKKMIQHQSIEVYELQVDNGVISKGRLMLSEEYDEKHLFKYNDSTINQSLYKDYVITKGKNNLVVLAEHKMLLSEYFQLCESQFYDDSLSNIENCINDTNDIMLTNIYKYNLKGKLTSLVRGYKDGDVNAWMRAYDNDNRMIETRNVSDGKLTGFRRFSYIENENGQDSLMYTIMNGVDTIRRVQYFYDDLNKLIEEHNFDERLNVKSHTIYHYDEYGKLKSIYSNFHGIYSNTNYMDKVTIYENYNPSKKTSSMYFEYVNDSLYQFYRYDSSNNLSSKNEVFFNSEGKIQKQYYFEYKNCTIDLRDREYFKNENKEIVKRYKLENCQYPVWRFEYTFDDHDNWIKRIDYKNGKPVSVAHREITYE